MPSPLWPLQLYPSDQPLSDFPDWATAPPANASWAAAVDCPAMDGACCSRRPCRPAGCCCCCQAAAAATIPLPLSLSLSRQAVQWHAEKFQTTNLLAAGPPPPQTASGPSRVRTWAWCSPAGCAPLPKGGTALYWPPTTAAGCWWMTRWWWATGVSAAVPVEGQYNQSTAAVAVRLV